MTEFDNGQKKDRRPKKYLWFGYGSYSGQPNLQIPAGNVRDPGVLNEFSQESNTKRSPVVFLAWVMIGVVGLTAFVMLLAWIVALVMR